MFLRTTTKPGALPRSSGSVTQRSSSRTKKKMGKQRADRPRDWNRRSRQRSGRGALKAVAVNWDTVGKGSPGSWCANCRSLFFPARVDIRVQFHRIGSHRCCARPSPSSIAGGGIAFENCWPLHGGFCGGGRVGLQAGRPSFGAQREDRGEGIRLDRGGAPRREWGGRDIVRRRRYER